MKREHRNSLFTGIAPEDDERVRSFNPHNGPCCTVGNFCVDLYGSPKSLWNISAAKVFADDFKLHHGDVCDDLKKIKAAFLTHLISLKRALLKRQLGEQAIENEQRKNRRNQRKRTVSIPPAGLRILPDLFC